MQAKVGDQCFSETFDRKLSSRIRRMRLSGSKTSPKPIHRTGVNDMTFITGDNGIEKGKTAKIDAIPTNRMGALPLVTVTFDKGATSTDTGVVK